MERLTSRGALSGIYLGDDRALALIKSPSSSVDQWKEQEYVWSWTLRSLCPFVHGLCSHNSGGLDSLTHTAHHNPSWEAVPFYDPIISIDICLLNASRNSTQT